MSTKAREFSIVKNNDFNPSTGKNNDCYDVVYFYPDGYGGIERHGFSISSDIYENFKDHFREVLPDYELTELRRQNEIMMEALGLARTGYETLKVAVNDHQKDLGATNFCAKQIKLIDEALAKCGKV